MGTKYLQHSNHFIRLAIRPLAARFASMGQTDRVIRMLEKMVPLVWQEFCRISAGLAVLNHPLDQNRSAKKLEHRGVAILARVQAI